MPTRGLGCRSSPANEPVCGPLGRAAAADMTLKGNSHVLFGTLRASASEGGLCRHTGERYTNGLETRQDGNACPLNFHIRAAHSAKHHRRLEDDKAETRWRSTICLGQMGAASAPHAKGVLEKVEDPDPQVRHAAVWALKQMTSQALVPHMKEIAKRLRNKEAEVRLCAVEVVEQMGDRARPLATELSMCLADPDSRIRRRAAEVFGGWGVAAAPQVNDVARCLGDSDPRVRQQSAIALGLLGRASVPYTNHVRAMLTDSDYSVRRTADFTLKAFKNQGPAAKKKRSGGTIARLENKWPHSLSHTGGAGL